MPEYFTLAELRAEPDMNDTGTYPDVRCEKAAAYIVGAIEREIGTSFIARTVTDEIHDGGGTGLVLEQGFALSVTSATIDAVAVSETLVLSHGIAYRKSGTTVVPWPAGIANIKVTYAAGYSTVPPADIKEMALKGTRGYLLANADGSMIDDRRTSLSTEMGLINFIVAGSKNPVGFPEVDAMILGWKDRIDVLGFA